MQDVSLGLLARCLSRAASPPMEGLLHAALSRAQSLGAIPFEAIAGTPIGRYGPRVTFLPGPAPRALAEAFGLGAHPYGVPAWIGLRIRPDGALHAKAYHRFCSELQGPGVDGKWPLPDHLPAGLLPVVAARDGDASELYLRLRTTCPWGDFATACTTPLLGPGATRPRIAFSPEPQPHSGAFCVSLRWQGERLAAITLYADQRALPDDEARVRAEWSRDMTAFELSAYELALAGVRASGPRRGAWHAMLAWTVDAAGTWQRAASLRVPQSPTPPQC